MKFGPIAACLVTIAVAAAGHAHSQTATCLDLTRDPVDPKFRANGIEAEKIDADAAQRTCSADNAANEADPMPWHGLARVALKRGNWRLAGGQFNEAITRGYAPALYRMADVCFLEHGDQAAAARCAVQWLEKAAAVRLPYAMSNLGFRLFQGRGTAQDIPRAIALWESSYELGEIGSAYWLGLAYSIRRACQGIRLAESRRAWFEKAAERKHVDAMNASFPICISPGAAAKKIRRQSRFNGSNSRAPKPADATGQFLLAHLHELGLGTEIERRQGRPLVQARGSATDTRARATICGKSTISRNSCVGPSMSIRRCGGSQLSARSMQGTSPCSRSSRALRSGAPPRSTSLPPPRAVRDLQRFALMVGELFQRQGVGLEGAEALQDGAGDDAGLDRIFLDLLGIKPLRRRAR